MVNIIIPSSFKGLKAQTMLPAIRTLLVFLILLAINGNISAQNADPPFLKYLNHPWVDSVLKTLSTEQQIAQCIWVAGYSNRDVSHEVEISDIIRKFGVGGIVFFQGTAAKQAELTNYYQKISRVPLLISLDAEWGIGMRIDNVEKFPYQMTLGAIKNDSLIYQFGKAVASQFKRLGMQMNLAPVTDININPQNPVINYRSFGENRDKVSSKSIMYMKGMQDNGILATGKHFPGHGDTNVDSHLDLPLITHSRLRLDSIELYPFRKLISEGIGSIMTAHLNLPSLDTTTGFPSSLSPVIIKELLKNELGFRGVIITDAMNMKGVTKYFKTGEADAKALEAGNDVVEFVTDVEAAINETKSYIVSKKLTNEDIILKCRKILALKYWSGLNKLQTINKENIDKELSPMTSIALIRDLYANALTVLNNNQNILPVKNLQKIKIATIAINRKNLSSFQKRIAKYHPADHYFIDPLDTAACNNLLKKLSDYDMVMAGVFGLDQRPNMDFGIKPGLNNFLEKLIGNNKTIITWFGNPYGIDKLKILQNADGLILAYQENEYTEDLSAQLIFGGIGARGSLPVTINNKWPSDYGIITPGNIRLQYGIPESVGMSSEILNSKIDSIVSAGLTAKAFPGCVVIAARKGVVVFQKAYGFQTYDNRIAVQEDDLYDLASVTKISSTLAGLMLLNTEGKFNPDKTLGFYLPDFKKTNKGNIVMRDFLTHQAGLTPFIPFWKETIKKDGKFRRNIFDYQYKKKYPLEVAQGLYINKNYRKKMFNEIKKSPIGEKKYVYSDLTFIIAPEIIETLTGDKWYDFVTDSIYKKIGAFDIGFNPYLKYPLNRIVPTEYDSLFRKQQLQGTVHDEGAAMLGGISGHAGLFATANDLMKLMELYRRMGNYGGEQLISNDILKEYTRVQFPENNNRRGLGFDKPMVNNSDLKQEDIYPTRGASPESFGHSGYTGTFVWIDPKYEITYIFFCNRVYPTRNNNLVYDLNIRTEILQVLYDSINLNKAK
jgi:beta-glucosidase-like glycosyl hydrolase/CubicO group peptidase (beta-lactamase class C family)